RAPARPARKIGGTAGLRPPRGPQVLARREVGRGRIAPPERPVVPARDEPQAVRDAVALQQRREVEVLPEKTIVPTRVEPEEGVRTAQLRSGRGDRVERRVVHEQRASVAEERAEVVGFLVAGPALDEAELPGVVNRDVDRAVTALRK